MPIPWSCLTGSVRISGNCRQAPTVNRPFIVNVASALGSAGLIATFGARSPMVFEVAFLVTTLVANLGMPALLAVNQNLVKPLRRGSATTIQ